VSLNVVRSGYLYLDAQGAQDDQTIAAGAKYSTDSAEIDCQGFPLLGVAIQATGANASSAGSVTFNFVTSLDGTNYEDDSNAQAETLTLSGTTALLKVIRFNVDFIRLLRVTSIVNGDASYGLSGVNVFYYMEDRLFT